MECEKCGTNYTGAFCPKCGITPKPAKEKKPIYKKWWFWVIIAVVIIAIAGNSGDSEDSTGSSNSSTVATPTNGADNEATEQTTLETTEATVASDNKYYVGDVINANGLNITYVSVETWETDNMFMQPEDGYMYIRLQISAENTASTDRYISSFEFECYADGKKESSTFVGDNTLEGGTLSSGRKTEGYIYFTVPTNAEEIEVEYETSFWTDKKAIFVVELP